MIDPEIRTPADPVSAPRACGRETRVVLVPNLTYNRGASMGRFCEELVSELEKRATVEVQLTESWSPQASGRRGQASRTLRGAARFIAYPLAVRRNPGDVYHVLDQGYSHVAALVPADRVIVTCHDVMPLRAHAMSSSYRVSRTTLAQYRLSVSLMRRAAHVACVSEATRRDVVRWVGVDPMRTSVIPNGVSDRFRAYSCAQSQRVRAAFPPGAKLLLHVDSGAPYKNVEATLRVLAELRAHQTHVLLIRVGAPLSTDQRALAQRLGVLDSVRELGAINDERLVDVYNSVDTLLFPSLWEGFGWPAAEALACGTPTVVSDCEPLLETVGGAALSAPAESPPRLAAAIRRIWDSPRLRAELVARGRVRAQYLSWNRAVERYASLYERIRREASPGRRQRCSD